MNDIEIEKIITKEFGNILDTKDEEIEKLSFLESCVYLETLNKVNEKIKNLKHQLIQFQKI